MSFLNLARVLFTVGFDVYIWLGSCLFFDWLPYIQPGSSLILVRVLFTFGLVA